MIIIYSYGTPGQYLNHWFMLYRPSYEGIELAFMQVMKMIAILASLSLILTTTTQQHFIGGLYQLLSLAKVFQVDANRFAVRIWLTLHYVETQYHHHHSTKEIMTLFKDHEMLNSQINNKETPITISTKPFKILDYCLLTTLFLFLNYLIGWF